jgi:hypothetical protein
MWLYCIIVRYVNFRGDFGVCFVYGFEFKFFGLVIL